MPFRNYAELVDEVVELIGRGSIRKKVPGWIQLAEREALVKIRDLREIKYKTTGNFTIDAATLTLPDGVMGIDGFEINENPSRTVRAATIDQLLERRAMETAAPDQYPALYSWVSGRNVELSPVPQAASPYTIYYTGAMVDVDELKVTSNILEQVPHYLLYAAAWHYALWARNDELVNRYGNVAAEVLADYMKFTARLRGTVQVGRHTTPGDHPRTAGHY